MGEPFDAFIPDVQQLVRSCDYSELEVSIICDGIVFRVQDDATRRKLLQTRKLDFNTAVDICRASQIVKRQLKAMLAN